MLQAFSIVHIPAHVVHDAAPIGFVIAMLLRTVASDRNTLSTIFA